MGYLGESCPDLLAHFPWPDLKEYFGRTASLTPKKYSFLPQVSCHANNFATIRPQESIKIHLFHRSQGPCTFTNHLHNHPIMRQA